jgi:outer membrane protein
VRTHTLLLLLLGGITHAEVHTLTLKQSVTQALDQSPDVVLARISEMKAREAVRVARDPFVPKVTAGSGAAIQHGYPNSIDGAAPSIFEVRTSMAVFNRPRSFALAETRENVRAAGFDSQARYDEVAFRTAALYLDAEQAGRNAQSLGLEVEGLERVSEAVRLRIGEGREMPLAGKKNAVDLARARQRQEAALADQQYAEESLALVLGYAAGDRVHPAEGADRSPLETPATEQEAVAAALQNSKELRSLESQLASKSLEVRAQKASRLPSLDLVAQYALFAKYNYQNFFQKFSRNNAQLGLSIQVPILVGSASSGLAAQAEGDVVRLRTEFNQARGRLSVETTRSFQDIKRAESARSVAKLDLEYTREQVSVLLAQSEEGRATRQAVDEARLIEQEKWLVYYESQHALEKARLNLLKQTGTIQAALK